MVRIHGYNKEKKEKGFLDMYGMAILFGIFVAAFLIVGAKGLIFLINILLKYWLWVLVVLFGIVLIKRFLLKRRKG